MVELDYLVIGHATNDLVDNAHQIGGTAVFAARTALALGCRVGVVSSGSADLDLSSVLNGVELALVPARATTTFENIYTSEGRRQMIHSVAARLTAEAVPADWEARVVHLGPVAQECDPRLAVRFPSSFLGVTPQGWMRRRDTAGRVRRRPWRSSRQLLRRADAIVLSDEDAAFDEHLLSRYAKRTRILAVTRAGAGCTLHAGGRVRQLQPEDVTEVDPTGAGDVFAAAFFVELHRSGDPWRAALLANCLAANSVTRPGLAGTPRPEEIARCRRALQQ